MSFCEIILIGNLGQDPELQYLDNGNARCQFSLAVSRNRRVNEEWVSETTWFRVTLWGSDAERATNTLHKGRMVVVTANHIEANAFVGNDGTPRASLQVNGRSFRALGRSERDGEGGGNYSGGQSSGGSSGGGGQKRQQSNRDEYYDSPPENVDDIPF